MDANAYHYSSRPTRNPFRYLLAVWRLVRNDPSTQIEEAAIVEMGFVNSRLGRRFARWDHVSSFLKADTRTADSFAERPAFGPISLPELEKLPEGTLGRVFADHCRARDLDPNLVYIPPEDETGWMLNRMFQTHDIWHVFTGWGNDLPGEFGLGGFYCAQLNSPPFFGYMVALLVLNVVMRRANLNDMLAAFTAGYNAGQHAEPLWSIDWAKEWSVPIEELRSRFQIDRSAIVGEGVRAAA
jgi:ubiquinone biosynthesis protein COQ4